MRLKSKLYKSSESTYFRKAARNFYLLAILVFTVCMLLNQHEYFINSRVILIVTDIASTVLIFSGLFLYIKKKIALKLSSAVYVYTTLFNLTISTWYYYYHEIFFANNFLLTTFLFCIQIVIAGLCIGRKHAFAAAGLYCALLGPLLFISHDVFLRHNEFAILFLIMAFSFGVSGFLNVLERTHKEELALKEEIFEKDRSINLEHYKRLGFELESKQKELTAKTMFMVEYAEKNTALFEELKTFKTMMKKQEKTQLDEVIQRYCIENSEKYWKEFEISFLEGNPEFFRKLSLVCTELSPAELKLATLLRLGLSSKQIGSLTSNTPASVDVARSRLRNKLNLPSNTNLTSFLTSL